MDIEAKGKAVMNYIAASYNVELDRWNNVKFSDPASGKEYRYKLMKNVIRMEVKVHHAASQYNKASSEWMRVKSIPVIKNYDKLVSKGLIS